MLDVLRASRYVEVRAASVSGRLEEEILPRVKDLSSCVDNKSELLITAVLLLSARVENEGVEGWKVLLLQRPSSTNKRHDSDVWDEDLCDSFFCQVVEELLAFLNGSRPQLPVIEAGMLLKLITQAVEALELPPLRRFVFKLLGLPSWQAIAPDLRDSLLQENPGLKPAWTRMSAALLPLAAAAKTLDGQMTSTEKQLPSCERRSMLELSALFLPELIEKVIAFGTSPETLAPNIVFVERALELLIRAYSLLPLRRVLRPLCSVYQLVCRLRMTGIRERCALFFDRLEELDGQFQEESDLPALQALDSVTLRRLSRFQRTLFELKGDALVHHWMEADRWNDFVKEKLSSEELEQIIITMNLCTRSNLDLLKTQTTDTYPDLLRNILLHNVLRPSSWPERIKATCCCPDEKTLWLNSDQLARSDIFTPSAMPKLSLQYLHLRDLFLRNFDLYCWESFYEVRQDIERAIYTSKPSATAPGIFAGRSRNACPIDSFAVVSVAPPLIGTEGGMSVPQMVRGELTLDLQLFSAHVRAEWDSLRNGDVLFIATISKPAPGTIFPQRLADAQALTDFPSVYSVLFVRTIELIDILDEEGKSHFKGGAPDLDRVYGTRRTLRVALDPFQYQQDVNAIVKGELSDGFYDTFNLLIRRRPEANNFKGVLTSLKSLLLGPLPKDLLPKSLENLLLGFGDAKAAHPLLNGNVDRYFEFGHTFKSLEHLEECFPFAKLLDESGAVAEMTTSKGRAETSEEVQRLTKPIALKFMDVKVAESDVTDVPIRQKFENSSDPAVKEDSASEDTAAEKVEPGPEDRALWSYYPRKERMNIKQGSGGRPSLVKFTASQALAIRAGLNEGVTLIVGPPGTGKTDTAVQLISLLMENYPRERIVIVSRSNQALNDVFTKVVDIGIDEKYLLRLGMGERELRIAQDEMEGNDELVRKDFSKIGRVNHILELRSQLLQKIQKLCQVLRASTAPNEMDQDCEAACQVRQWIVPSRRKLSESCKNRVIHLHKQEGTSLVQAVKQTLNEARKEAPWWRCYSLLDGLAAWWDLSDQDRQSWISKMSQEIACQTDLLTSPDTNPPPVAADDDIIVKLSPAPSSSAVTEDQMFVEKETAVTDDTASVIVSIAESESIGRDDPDSNERLQTDETVMQHRPTVTSDPNATIIPTATGVAISNSLVNANATTIPQNTAAATTTAMIQTSHPEGDNGICGEEEHEKQPGALSNRQQQQQQSAAQSALQEASRKRLRLGYLVEQRLTAGDGPFEGGSQISMTELFFPLLNFWPDEKLFGSARSEEDATQEADRLYDKIEEIFEQTNACRPFELLRNTSDRAEYMTSVFAKIIAMTSTHAALVRQQLIASDFRYDTIVIEEAGQIFEIEAVLSLILQKAGSEKKDNEQRLKRIILLGDHLQLAPIVQNRVIGTQGNLEQSLFTRLIRLGAPYIQLDAQGRCRPELADLFNWRYTSPPLRNLPHVYADRQYRLANPGFAFTYQFVDCEEGAEICAAPHYYQNREEAQYAVLIFMYMRLLGYPAETISILTSYNGQKDLIKELLHQKCARNPLIGLPHKVTTIDKFQGQENYYIILSLVRTVRIGHLADPCRLTVAMSRAKLGLYIVGNLKLIAASHSLKQFFARIFQKPTKLAILHDEKFDPSANTRSVEDITRPLLVQSVSHMSSVVTDLARRQI